MAFALTIRTTNAAFCNDDREATTGVTAMLLIDEDRHITPAEYDLYAAHERAEGRTPLPYDVWAELCDTADKDRGE